MREWVSPGHETTTFTFELCIKMAVAPKWSVQYLKKNLELNILILKSTVLVHRGENCIIIQKSIVLKVCAKLNRVARGGLLTF